MKTTTKTAKKAPAKKAAKKTAAPAKLLPLTFELPARNAPVTLRHLFDARTSKQLKEALRARKLPIPKDKKEMSGRLADFFEESGALLFVSIA